MGRAVVAEPLAGTRRVDEMKTEQEVASEAAGAVQRDDQSDTHDYQRRLGARLRAVRRAQGLRLQDVEDRSEGRFKAVVVGSYERGDRAVSAPRLSALAAFYDVPVSSLLPDDERVRRGERQEGMAISVERLRAYDGDDVLPLRRLVDHIQWLRGDYGNRVLSLRGDDLQAVAVGLGLDPAALPEWLRVRGLAAD